MLSRSNNNAMLGCKVQQNYSHPSMNIRASRKKYHQTKKCTIQNKNKKKNYQKATNTQIKYSQIRAKQTKPIKEESI